MQWFLAIGWMFGNSEWAHQHPMLALLLLMPSFSMINSKMIVCTVTKMKPAFDFTTFGIFSTFYMNKHHCKCNSD